MWDKAEKSRTFLRDFAWTCGVCYAKTIGPRRAIMDEVLLKVDKDRRYRGTIQCTQLCLWQHNRGCAAVGRR